MFGLLRRVFVLCALIMVTLASVNPAQGQDATPVPTDPEFSVALEASLSSVDQGALLSGLETFCNASDPGFDQGACDSWYYGLGPDEQAWLEAYLNSDDDVFSVASTGDESASYVSTSSGGSVKYYKFREWQYTRLNIRQYTFYTWQYWCSKNYVITGCLSSGGYPGHGIWGYVSHWAQRVGGGTGYGYTSLNYYATFHTGIGPLGATCTALMSTTAYANYTGAPSAGISWAWNRCI